uniref:AMP-binding domain-containing protein n=1 Tax=Steinernema glaseri TaxID=37863 RepID=A0A1I8AWD6_9BILA
MLATSVQASSICATWACSHAWACLPPSGRPVMSPELQHFEQVLRRHAEHTPNAIALWGDQLKLDYATLQAEVQYRQQRLRDESARVVALALDNGVEAMLWDLAL